MVFRPSKKRKFYRQREDDVEPKDGQSEDSAPVASPTQRSPAAEDNGGSVAEALRLRNMRKTKRGGVEFRPDGSLHPITLVDDFLDPLRRPLRKHGRPVPHVEQELPAWGEMIGGDAECRLQGLIGGLIAHDMKQGYDRIKGAAEACSANIPDFAGEGAGSSRGPRAARRSRNRDHLRAAFDAVDVKAHGCEEPSVSTGAGAELKDRARAWDSRSKQPRNVLRLRGIVLVAVKQVIISGILLKIGHELGLGLGLGDTALFATLIALP